jgi:crotonobetainyl-CoA:carnitine CoA-transferase CaiB-like acyl-CoA transferase
MAYSVASGEPVPPMPARVSAWAIYHQFDTADNERVFIGVTSDKQWVRFCIEFERDDWLNDERLATNNSRIKEREWFMPQLRTFLLTQTKADIMQKCESANLPFSPIARPEDLFDDPQLNAGGSLLDIIFPDGRHAKLPRQPVLLSEHDWGIRSHPPQIGEHTTEILSELDLNEKEIAQLKAEKIVI